MEMITGLTEPMPEVFTRSKVVVLDFSQLHPTTPQTENIQLYFDNAILNGINPRLPQSRQLFHDRMLSSTGARYLIGRYGEDRLAMLSDTPAGKSGRTIHLAIDVWSRDLEPVLAPFSGRIVRTGYEEGFGEYGNYLILEPSDADYYVFYGHLSNNLPPLGPITGGQAIARLGDFKNNENGGWARHLHIQILRKLPTTGSTPNGYSSKADFARNSRLYPNPLNYFSEWRLR